MNQQQKAQQSRERILQAAIEEFSAQGYSGCTIDKLCRRHGLSKGMVFYHFKNKEEIFLRCVEHCCALRLQKVGKQLRQAGGSPEENLVLCYKAIFQFYRQDPQAHRLLCIAAEAPPPSLEPSLAQVLAPFQKELRRFIAANISRLPLRPGVSPQQVLSAVEWFLDYISVRNKKSLKENYSEIVEIVEEQQKEFDFFVAMLLHGVVQ